MAILIESLLIVIPMIGMITGPSVSTTILLFLFTCLYMIQKQMSVTIQYTRLEIACVIWLIASCFWSIDLLHSLFSILKVLSLVIITYILILNKEVVIAKINFSTISLCTSILLSILIFSIEDYSNGYINSCCKQIIYNKSHTTSFYLYYLNRGCNVLALFAWFVIALLIKRCHSVIALVIYIVTLYTLFLSDSLASFVGFVLSGLVFSITQYWPFNTPKLLSFCLIICSILFIVGVYGIDPKEVSNNQVKSFPISAKHRLFIWNFTLNKIFKKPFTGYGFNSSKKIKLTTQDFMEYNNLKLSLLPLHPHNHLLQIILETGIIGFILYLSLITKYLSRWHVYFSKDTTDNMLNIRSAGYACFCTFFVISMISFNMWQSWWICCYLWITLLFCLLTSKPK